MPWHQLASPPSGICCRREISDLLPSRSPSLQAKMQAAAKPLLSSGPAFPRHIPRLRQLSGAASGSPFVGWYQPRSCRSDPLPLLLNFAPKVSSSIGVCCCSPAPPGGDDLLLLRPARRRGGAPAPSTDPRTDTRLHPRSVAELHTLTLKVRSTYSLNLRCIGNLYLCPLDN